MEETDRALEVKERHLKSLMDIEGVLGVGIGLEGEKTVIVVNVKDTKEEIISKIPEELEGIPVKIEKTGEMKRREEDEV